MESQYYVQKSSWWIYIKIVAEAVDYHNKQNIYDVVNVGDGLWIAYTDVPLIKGELFTEDDLVYLIKGLNMVTNQVRANSEYKETLIVIQSLQYSPCDFQEEGLIAVMMQWCAQYFGFDCPEFKVEFDKNNNRYVFEFD